MDQFFSLDISKVTPDYGAAMKIDINIYVEKCGKSSTSIYILIAWVLLLWHLKIQHILKRRIPRSNDLVRYYWFYNHFLKQSHLQFFLNLRKLFTASTTVHKFSLCFICTDQWASGQQCMEFWKAIIPGWNGTRILKEKRDIDHILKNDHYRIKTTQPISLILVSFFFLQKTMFYLMELKYPVFSNSKVMKMEPSAFFGTPGTI